VLAERATLALTVLSYSAFLPHRPHVRFAKRRSLFVWVVPSLVRSQAIGDRKTQVTNFCLVRSKILAWE